MQKPVTKAVVLAAGFGTRFLPASKAVPKVMFPVVDRPIIQYVIEEIVAGGITDITIVLSPFTQDIREHFETFPELNALLAKSGKEDKVEELKRIESLADFHFVEQRQGGPIGTGMAVLAAKEIVGNNPFVLSWSDEVFRCNPPRVKQLIDVYNKYGGTVLGCMRTTDPKDGARWGFVVGDDVEDKVIKVKQLVEKPGEGKAPSELTTTSGQVLVPEIFDYLEREIPNLPEGKELYYNVQGLGEMLKDGHPIYAAEYQNCEFFDTGDRLGYLKTMVELGLENKEFGEKFREYLKSISI